MRRSDLKPYWNTNVARHPDILRAVPEGCGDALDVGCGDGLLARKLAEGGAKRVMGIDAAPGMVSRARELAAGRPGLSFVEGDFLTAELPAGGFDFICSVAAVHHMDFEAAVTRMRELLRPGGRLVIVALARNAGFGEWVFWALATPLVWLVKAVRRARPPAGMPGAAPTMSHAQAREAAQRLLPGVRYRRHLLRRYSLTWENPGH
ncbi:class I SAM-dependent methyltransferase [Streptomyces hoynatensis]|uniref:Class I SAM-dependent methyltransferase n=1 Tax=Streptomyces hoynatensis TaxID=1141874 RepID=A0A3A9Z0A8_9ACTN|nr:class I SAM-dependent methyltransferase [Streptomyces hoynatensis]RKN41872.1 class I SAM-dependent methyltransferase [Streptomyces hoynatensis]